VPARINAHLRLKRWQPRCKGKRVVLEGGSIDVNGAGLLLTTEECLLSPIQARNPHLSRDEIEQTLQDYLGVKKILWLGNGIAGDDTHGHVDDLARFVAAGTVVTALEENRADPNHAPLQENLRRLGEMTDVAGKALEVVTLPLPAPLIFNGQRLPVSYANFYIGNEKVLVPTFNDPNDRMALGILGDLFPKRNVVGIHAVDLVWGLGTLHCMTQQQPRAF
jgi:agmatine deiminase